MTKVATRDAYAETLVELGRENPNIVVLDADLSVSTKTLKFAREFPGRFFNMGIAEQNMIGTAAGLASAGKIPFASTFAIFATGRAFEQIRNTVAYSNLNVKIAASHAGISVGEDGSSHQSIEDIALMRAIPNMTLLVPADGVEAKKLVRAAAEHYGPVYIRLGRPAVPVLSDEAQSCVIGQAVVFRESGDVCIFATGHMVAAALAAADILAGENVRAGVVNIHTLKPIDEETIVREARAAGAVVTAEEHTVIGGLGGAVCEVLGERHPVPVERVGLKDVFGESGSPEELFRKFGLTPGDIAAAARRAVQRKSKG